MQTETRKHATRFQRTLNGASTTRNLDDRAERHGQAYEAERYVDLNRYRHGSSGIFHDPQISNLRPVTMGAGSDSFPHPQNRVTHRNVSKECGYPEAGLRISVFSCQFTIEPQL